MNSRRFDTFSFASQIKTGNNMPQLSLNTFSVDSHASSSCEEKLFDTRTFCTASFSCSCISNFCRALIACDRSGSENPQYAVPSCTLRYCSIMKRNAVLIIAFPKFIKINLNAITGQPVTMSKFGHVSLVTQCQHPQTIQSTRIFLNACLYACLYRHILFISY